MEERYDSGDGVFGPSWYRAEIISNDAFAVLQRRAVEIEGFRDCPYIEIDAQRETPVNTYMSCNVGQVEIYVNEDDNKTDHVVLVVTDPFSGRDLE